MTDIVRQDDRGVIIDIWVVPGARGDAVSGLHGSALKIRTSQPAEGGRANAAVARILGSAFGVRRPRLVSGDASRHKTFLLPDLTLQRAQETLRKLVRPID